VKVIYGQTQIIDELKFQDLRGLGGSSNSSPTDSIDRIVTSEQYDVVIGEDGNVVISEVNS
jgi:hypothetical protein